MCKRLSFFLLLLTGCAITVKAQELQARITVNAQQVNSKVDKKVFQTLQASLQNFLNNRSWTEEKFETNERIVCNFLLTLQQTDEDNVYNGSLTIQAARPVYGAAYQTPLINFRDENISFKYVEYQPIEFNENRVSGSDAQVSNLSASFAYYVYIILGLDFDSFSLKGGQPFFQKAMQIVNSAPDGRNIQGWKAFDGTRNRYWLAENLTNAKYALIHDAIYSYYRDGLDHMYEDPAQSRTAVLNTVNLLNTLNNDMPNSMIIPFFLQGKSQELIGVFRKADMNEKSRARDLLAKIDVTNANAYKQELK